jgi:DNA-binding PadR family transcriptional regulator
MTKTFINDDVHIHDSINLIGGEIMPKNIYKPLVAKVESVDYIKGPEMKFDVKKSVNNTHKSLLEKACSCTDKDSMLTCKDYNLSLLADFMYNLEKQAAQGATMGTPNALALYFKNKGVTDYISRDELGRKYIRLTEAGVKLFREIWNSGRTIRYDNVEIPFSQLERDGFNIIRETVDMKNDGTAVEEEKEEEQATIVVKENKGPKILAQNAAESTGFAPEDNVPDKSIIGPRRTVKGNYLMRGRS